VKLKVINLYAGPGSGKSTTAAGLFNLMKTSGYSVELVTEAAKDRTYERAWDVRNNQLLLFAQQDHRLRRLEGQVEWAVTDSPLPLGCVYIGPLSEYGRWLPVAIWSRFAQYNNHNVMIRRVKPYQTFGRTQTEAEARALDAAARGTWEAADTLSASRGFEVDGDAEAPYAILHNLGLAVPVVPRKSGLDWE
jgi:ABC-type oligopeptide transport system ATPase subunit